MAPSRRSLLLIPADRRSCDMHPPKPSGFNLLSRHDRQALFPVINLFGLPVLQYMEGQLDAVAQILLVKNAADVPFYSSQT